MALYAKLQVAASQNDVLLLYNGLNLHPEFLQQLNTYNVYCCFDDPESSAKLSEPVANSFDACFCGNIASLPQYRSWGCKRVCYLPVFTNPSAIPGKSEESTLFTHKRSNDIVLCCEKNEWRRGRLEALASSFPQAQCHGKNWSPNRISDQDLQNLYRNTKIGWNVHNSTGPINIRLFDLPAFGILQICDNRTGLGKILKLDEEVIGFDTIPEAIEKTTYYLENEEERQQIARSAYNRYWKDYHPQAIWCRIEQQIRRWIAQSQPSSDPKKRYNPKIKPGVHEVVQHLLRDGLGWTHRHLLKSAKDVKGYLRNQNGTLDEGFYLGEKIPFVPKVKDGILNLLNIKSVSNLRDPNHLDALDWALSTMVGKSKRIIGFGSSRLKEYISVQPGRTVNVIELTETEKQTSEIRVKLIENTNQSIAKFDLLICSDPLLKNLQLEDVVVETKKFAKRAIYCIPGRNCINDNVGVQPKPKSTKQMVSLLRNHFQYVYLYYMPNSFVPWIEPIRSEEIFAREIIAECL